MLNYSYGFAVRNMDAKQRREFMEMLRPEPEFDESLIPERLRRLGIKPPPGWKAVSDPFAGG